MKNDRNHVVIRAKSAWYEMDLKGIWRYRDLVMMFVRRNFVLQYKQTLMGPLWLVVGPLLSSLIFTFVFGQFAGLSTDGVPHYLFYMAGSTLWTLFSSGVASISNTFSNNSAVMGKVYFPRLVIPVSQMFTTLFSFLLQFVILCAVETIYGLRGTALPIGPALLLVPVLLAQTLLLALGVGLIITSLTTKYRDLAIAVGFGVQLWMYASPVVYPLSLTGGYMRNIIQLNPMAPILENFRYALFGSGGFMGEYWALSLVVTAILLATGLALFSRSEKTFLDTI